MTLPSEFAHSSSSCVKNTEDDEDEDERCDKRPFSLYRWEDSSEDDEDASDADELDELDNGKLPDDKDRCGCCLLVLLLMLMLLLLVEMLLLLLAAAKLLGCLMLTLFLLLLLLLLLMLLAPLVKPFPTELPVAHLMPPKVTFELHATDDKRVRDVTWCLTKLPLASPPFPELLLGKFFSFESTAEVFAFPDPLGPGERKLSENNKGKEAAN